MTFFTANRILPLFKWLLVAIALLIFNHLLINSVSAAQLRAFETTENIKQAAKKFLEEISNAADNPSIEVTVNNLDPRLKLRRCDNKLKAYLPKSSKERGKVSVAVQCNSPVAWKLFVSASIDEYADVVVANHSLTRKSIIGNNDIVLKRIKVSSLRKKPLNSKLQVLGSSAKRHIRVGSIIFEDSICMVCRGDNVQISANNEFLNINLQGIALADATIGETTLVRNKQSKRSFSATVIGRNRLEVSLTAAN